jgi:hypothetical protein
VTVDGASGLAVDIDADGALLIADGTRRHRVVAGDLTEAPAPPVRGAAASPVGPPSRAR